MPLNADRRTFRNEDLVLKVSPNVDRAKWDESRYEAFLDELCGDREYQKDAILIALRYFLGGQYRDLRALARANFDENSTLGERYGSWTVMERHLQFPDVLSASLDLATATGKSYALYGIAAILLAEGAVDRVLILCPSTTIEAGLIDKFKKLASDKDLQVLLPTEARVSAPRIMDASETITEGSICVENYHAILQHVGSSIRDSLAGRGARVAVLNDEAHHVANEQQARIRRWKEFLSDPTFGFRYILGVSGTCYVDDEYFADVIFRYSLTEAMEERRVKRVNYVAEMPQTEDPDEKWQLVRNLHEDAKRKLRRRDILPLTIIVTPNIDRCRDVAEDLKSFLIEAEHISREEADERALVVYNDAPDVLKLSHLDAPESKVEWIVSVSMLNEGWDVKRVFQIVPHEERAFNSKLLIAQVLGRGLRMPERWQGPQPEVTVFNHDAWAPRIRHLVHEVLEIENRITCRASEDSPFHFDLLNIEYALEETSVTKPMTGPYTLFAKGYVDLAADVPEEGVIVEFERAENQERFTWETRLHHRTYTPREVAVAMYSRLEDAQEFGDDGAGDDESTSVVSHYTDDFPVEKLEAIVVESLRRRGMTVATESVKQKFLQSLGTLRRKQSQNVRYVPDPTRYFVLSTRQRPANSISASELRTGSDKSVFYTDETRATLTEEQVETFDELTELGGGYRCIPVLNSYDFKSPLNFAIADSLPERRFVKTLLDSASLPHYDSWIKSTAVGFYEIQYFWKKGEHPKRGSFSPDFFVKVGDVIFVIEIKGDEELEEPSVENRKKNEYAEAHFARVNDYLAQQQSPIRYKFSFLTPRNFNAFFQYLRERRIMDFRSELDVKLSAEE